jgi:threonine/homoserine/homoserine lactone efflux protein
MITSLLQGMVLGMGLSVLVGPILFILVQASLDNGYKMGLLVAAGVWISDIVYLILAHWLVDWLDVDLLGPDIRFMGAMIGGTIMLAVGITFLLKKQPAEHKAPQLTGKSLAYFLSLGFSTNAFNPFTVFFWFTVMATAVAKRGHSFDLWVFLIGILGTVMFFDSAKVFGAHWLRNRLRPSTIFKVRKISALVIVAFGLWLISYGLFG